MTLRFRSACLLLPLHNHEIIWQSMRSVKSFTLERDFKTEVSMTQQELNLKYLYCPFVVFGRSGINRWQVHGDHKQVSVSEIQPAPSHKYSWNRILGTPKKLTNKRYRNSWKLLNSCAAQRARNCPTDHEACQIARLKDNVAADNRCLFVSFWS